jgi:uncharacterized RDD family membrane protein YckC
MLGGVNEQPAPDYAVGARVGAAIIDLLVMVALFVLMAALLGEFGNDGDNGFRVALNGPSFILFLVLMLAYFFLLETYMGGRTIGKAITGVHVVLADGGALTPGAVAIRTLLRLVDALPGLYLVGFVLVMATKEHQRLGDMAAKTLVVRTRR